MSEMFWVGRIHFTIGWATAHAVHYVPGLGIGAPLSPGHVAGIVCPRS